MTTIYAVTTRDGTSEVTFDAMEAGEFGETDAEGELLSAPNQCDDNFFALADFSTSTPGLQPYKWYPADLPMRWHFNSGSNPGYLVLDNTEDSLKDGTAAWKTIFDACGMADTLSDDELDTSYAGRSPNASVDISNTSVCDIEGQNDGVSRVGFGDLLGIHLGAACRWGNANYSPVRLSEADFRINKDDFLWWNTPLTCTGYRFMVREVATHERGHNFGPADIDESTHGNLTMSKNVNAPCMQTAYSLGRGDVYGIRDIYDNP